MRTTFLSLVFALSFIIFLGCSSDSGQIGEPKDDADNGEVSDETPPAITLNGLGSVIENYTNIEVSITDESSTETTILIDGVEIFNTATTDFNYNLNPYPQPVGNAEIKIISEDSQGNVAEKVYEVEIKHMLMDFNLGDTEVGQYTSFWVFFNDSNGNIITTSKVDPGSSKVYTDLVVEEDTMYYTLVEYETNGENVAHSLTNMTYTVGLGKTREIVSQSLSINRSESIEININRTELVNEYSKYTAKGSKYGPISFSFTSAPSYSEIFTISYDHPENVYLRTEITNGGNPFDGKKENYHYTKFEPDPLNTEIVLNEADFKSMDDSFVQSIPAYEPGSFNLSRYGFENETDFEENISHWIYEVSTADISITDYLDLPILDGIEFYKNIASYSFNGKFIRVESFGNTLDLSTPNWDISDFGIQGENYFVETSYNNVDYYLMRLSKISETSNPRKSFYWIYRTFNDNQNEVPILDFPLEISEELGDSFYSTTGLEIDYITAVDFESIDTFSAAMEYLGLNKPILDAHEKGYTTVRF